MAEFSAEQYVLEVWKSNHAGHTITRQATTGGRVRYSCSCGNALLLDADNRAATDALALPPNLSGE